MSTTANNGGLVGHMVPFLLGLPSVRAMVVDISHGKQYILQQRYTTEDERGNHIDVEKQYYRDRSFIDAYWADTHGR